MADDELLRMGDHKSNGSSDESSSDSDIPGKNKKRKGSFYSDIPHFIAEC